MPVMSTEQIVEKLEKAGLALAARRVASRKVSNLATKLQEAKEEEAVALEAATKAKDEILEKILGPALPFTRKAAKSRKAAKR